MFKTHSKFDYSSCQLHTGELLSLVCVDKPFKQQRLMCRILKSQLQALCEYSTQNAKCVPLKMLLNSVSKSENDDVEGMNLLDVAMFLDRAHLDSLKAISKLQEHTLQLTQILSERVEKYYLNLKEFLKQFAQRLIPQHVIMDYLSSHDNNLTKMDNYLSQLIKNYSFSETGQVTKLNIYKSVMDQCSGKFKELNDKLIEIQKEFDTRTDSLKDAFLPMEVQSVTQAFTVSDMQFTFSPVLKGANIQLSNNNMQAEQKSSESNGQRFVLCEPSLPKGGKIVFGFKVKKYSGWVGVGVCHKKVIQTAGYKFNYTNIGHGSYLISNNAYSWSHLEKELNSSHKSFDFGINDIVYVQVDYTAKTVTWKKNNTATTYSMTIDVTQELCPCANLCSPGDIVELVNKVDVKF